MKTTKNVVDSIASEQAMLSGNRFANAVKKKIFFLQKLRSLIREDLKNKTHLSLKHALRAWRHGFLRFRYKLYGLDKSGDPTRFISDFASWTTHAKFNGRFAELMSNKYAFGLLMKLQGMPTPGIKGLILKGIFHPQGAVGTTKASDAVLNAITPGEALVLKPIWGWHGFGFICLDRDGDEYRVNREIVPRPSVAAMVDRLDDYLVTEFVTQGEFCRGLYPHTPNTIRMVTLWDASKSEAFVARAVMRIGTSRSFPVDNFKAGRGGLSVMIDPQSGEMGPGAMAADDGEPVWHRRHPESHAPIQGVAVPAWNAIRTRILDYAGRFAFIPYIGWDIILTDNGFSILEVNPTSGMPVLQVHGPLLEDPRVKRFFQAV